MHKKCKKIISVNFIALFESNRLEAPGTQIQGNVLLYYRLWHENPVFPGARLVRGGWHQTDKHQLETELCMLYPHTPHIRRQSDGPRPNTYSRSGYCISFQMECIVYLAIVHSTKHPQPWKLTQNFISVSLVINYNKIKSDLNKFNSNLIWSFLLFCILFTSLKNGTIWILNS